MTYNTSLSQIENHCKDRQISDSDDLTESDEFDENWIEDLRNKGFTEDMIRVRKGALSAFRKWREKEKSTQIDLENGIILTKEQTINLLSSTESLRDVSIILIALKTGANPSEILNLNKDDIHNEDNDYLILFNPRKGERPRQVPINPSTFGILHEYTNTLPIYQERLFIYNDKIPAEVDEEVRLMLIECGNKIGIDNLNFRSLRNTFIHNFKGTNSELKHRLGTY